MTIRDLERSVSQLITLMEGHTLMQNPHMVQEERASLMRSIFSVVNTALLNFRPPGAWGW